MGVPALCEPLEVRVRAFSDYLMRSWDDALPPGFFFTGYRFVPEKDRDEARALSKLCEASSYILGLRGPDRTPLAAALEEMMEEGVVLNFHEAGRGLCRCIVERPSERGPGLLVKELRIRGIIEGWPEIFIFREAVGRLRAGSVTPLTPSVFSVDFLQRGGPFAEQL